MAVRVALTKLLRRHELRQRAAVGFGVVLSHRKASDAEATERQGCPCLSPISVRGPVRGGIAARGRDRPALALIFRREHGRRQNAQEESGALSQGETVENTQA